MTGRSTLEALADDIGPDGPVCPVGGRTQWDVGGPPAREAREVGSPAGVVAHHPAEMIVRVRAGTTLAHLQDAVAAGGQHVALEADDPGRATVGGLLAVGRSGVRRLGWGPVRDTVLEVTAVNSRGELIRAGAPLVKNVTGFDLCRLLVGSLGTLAVLAEVVLRCRPRPDKESWWTAEGVDPFALAQKLYRPLAVLWDGSSTWVGLAGDAGDVSAQAAGVLGRPFVEAAGPPPRPGPLRRSWPPGQLRGLPAGRWLAEVGVGVVHCDHATADALGPPPPPDRAVVDLHAAIKARFDPSGRMNPGRSVMAGA